MAQAMLVTSITAVMLAGIDAVSRWRTTTPNLANGETANKNVSNTQTVPLMFISTSVSAYIVVENAVARMIEKMKGFSDDSRFVIII
jgi:hypothetical protein